ncbi:MAG: hypothetical protein ETSY2_04710 [Candidatus Entotheonella gemina]|uniref:Uncharacterized protein n=1 Tax=Candidatus Entotheonella gemina TaxID=1429439 RepID=W4MDY3_9BACT|nr:MAG: hypothetical protein ETSY2_04710 [Candidatus Entotheonella gemina]
MTDAPSRPLSKEPAQRLTPKEYIEHEEAMSNIALRERAASFLSKAYAGLLASTVLIIFRQGFHLWGFQLDAKFLNWLGAATIGEVAGLAALVYGALFKKSS